MNTQPSPALRVVRSVFALLAFGSTVAIAAPGCAPIDDAEVDGSDEIDTAEPVDQDEDALLAGTVADAVLSSCSTTSVKGLSLQIIAEGNCITPGAYAQVPTRSNLTLGSAVFPFLEKPARDQLVASLDARPSTRMTINSMLRTVAQQHLLFRWFKTGRCSIMLAATPGNSNHETGLALDVSEASTWRSTLEGRGFRFFGSADPVHFDYVGSGAVSHKGLDVKAFQRLWNRNNPQDLIAADGIWGPQTEARMNKSPAAGFAKGAICGG
jgi:hypothetical protein